MKRVKHVRYMDMKQNLYGKHTRTHTCTSAPTAITGTRKCVDKHTWVNQVENANQHT